MKNIVASTMLAGMMACNSSPVYAESKTSLCEQNTRDRVAIIVQGDGGQSTQWKLALCHGKEEKFSSPITTGKPKGGRGSWTPEWNFSIQWMEKKRFSKSYNNAPMPFAMHVYKGIFIHEGKVGEGQSSHGCIRLPKGNAKNLFELVAGYQGKREVHVVVKNTNPNTNKDGK